MGVLAVFCAAFLLAQSAAYAPLPCKRHSGGIPLPLGVFTVKDGRFPDVMPAINVAARHIHERSCLLLGYKIELIVKDTQCKTSMGMKALFDLIAARPRPVAILGGVCTQVNEPIAMALKYWQIVQLSYAETHAKFASSDSQELFPTFFRVVPGSRNTNAAKCHLVKYMNWTRVGTVKQSDHPRFALPHEALTTRLEHGFGVRVVHTAGVNREQIDSIGSQLDELKERDVRILLMDADSEMSATVLCAAYHRGMYGDNYVWILPGYHSEAWMSDVNCTKEEMDTVLRNHFAVGFALARADKNTIVAGHTKAVDILKELDESNLANMWKGYLYDGFWTLAMALNEAMSSEAEFSHHRMIAAINNASFEGVTGTVKFVNNERLGLVDVLQYRDDSYKFVGQYDGVRDLLQIHALDDWNPPLDSTVTEKRREYISRMLLIAMSLLALVGISLAIIFLFINFRYRNHRFIKMSSPNLNNIIIAGSICTFASVILLGLDTRALSPDNFVRMCYVIHSIFTNIRMDRKAIKDSKLLMILGVLLLLDVVVLTAWAIFSPFSFSVIELPHIPADNKVIVPEVEKCHSNNSVVFQAILYVIKGILMILGCFLAWETRHVNVPALNDSKYIGMSVYNVVVMSVLGLSTSVILQERVNESFALASFFVIFSTTLTLCLVFVPKVIELARNPVGNEPRAYRRGFMKSVVAKTSQPSSPAPNSDNASDLLSKAETENKVRRRYLHQKSVQLWDLVEKLRAKGDTQFLQQDWCLSSATPSSFEKDSLLRSSNRDETSTSAAF
ncbi:unnamed protein product [Caenorhabditis auriculariae]|uniref:G-protein coupled receptors family 3 profile domain-containing protein n=1 Tax=Caenorhabditis auriculariae TaxID=2777116 RepID=A0A8S1H3F7_9PELO|nr:unnamed protein product [Caenorhabditis auriculariae]